MGSRQGWFAGGGWCGVRWTGLAALGLWLYARRVLAVYLSTVESGGEAGRAR